MEFRWIFQEEKKWSNRSRTRTIDSSHDSHGPWLFRTRSVVQIGDRILELEKERKDAGEHVDPARKRRQVARPVSWHTSLEIPSQVRRAFVGRSVEGREGRDRKRAKRSSAMASSERPSSAAILCAARRRKKKKKFNTRYLFSSFFSSFFSNLFLMFAAPGRARPSGAAARVAAADCVFGRKQRLGDVSLPNSESASRQTGASVSQRASECASKLKRADPQSARARSASRQSPRDSKGDARTAHDHVARGASQCATKGPRREYIDVRFGKDSSPARLFIGFGHTTVF